jgi:hypothetical protein
MPSRGVFYGTVVVLVALLVVVSTIAAFYYGQDEQNSSQNVKYVGELNTALASYRSLSENFNSSLVGYKLTLTLLASALSNLNTTTPAYRIGSQSLASLWSSYQQLSKSTGRRALVYEVRMLVDFGNGTRRWYNDTAVQPGWNGYVATLVLMNGNIQATWYPQYGEHFVSGIGGVSAGTSNSWFFWEYGSGGWTVAQTGADGLQVNNGTLMAWTLCGYDSNFNPTCRP